MEGLLGSACLGLEVQQPPCGEFWVSSEKNLNEAKSCILSIKSVHFCYVNFMTSTKPYEIIRFQSNFELVLSSFEVILFFIDLFI